MKVSIDELQIGSSPRRAMNVRHVEVLADLNGEWDPIVVQRASLLVIDGRHRVAAARKLGHSWMRVVLFDGSDAEAKAEAVRLNVHHGLPLSLAERMTAARDLLDLFPGWSDRQLGATCGLSPRTVARLRLACVPDPAGIGEPGRADKRLGSDGRLYPRRAGALREQIRQALEEDPTASLRAVAARCGASPETVRSVRKSVQESSRTEPVTRSRTGPDVVWLPTPLVTQSHPQGSFADDSACASTDQGRDFAAWFDAHTIDQSTIVTMAEAIPLSRVYDVLDETLRRSALWETFTQVLQNRLGRRGNTGQSGITRAN